MDLSYIKEQVSKISAMADDDESAHCAEDDLHVEFIAYVAQNGSAKLRDMATEVLKTSDINFSRWYA